MLFNSLIFIIFAALFFLFWPIVRKGNDSRWLYLVIFSFIFYGWWDWRFLFLIAFSGLVDYYAALGMARFEKRRKLFLILSLIGNIGSLAIFKYLDFFIENINWVLKATSIQLPNGPLPEVGLLLPVGISFYTFQSMSYSIDVYRGEMKPTKNVLHFFAYLSLFPQLVAGPIVRAKELLPQLKSCRAISEEERWDALKMIIRGFFKKMVVADVFSRTINEAFAVADPNSGPLFWWVIMILFAFQIYCDFSGYSDIAIGLGKWMGYDFPTNFNHPYIAGSMREFWGRWHISLSTWFRDYVYIPLGGNRCSAIRADINMWITMLVSGFWHGAGWPFLIWGALHAFYLTLERVTKWPKRVQQIPYIGRHLSVLITFALVLIAWVFFRAGTYTVRNKLPDDSQFNRAWDIIVEMFSFQHLFNAEMFDQAKELVEDEIGIILGIIILRQLFFHFRLEEKDYPLFEKPAVKRYLVPVFYAFAVAGCVFFRGEAAEFIYFQF